MELKNIIFIIVFLAVFGFFAYSVNNLIKYLKVAKKKDDRFDNIPTRLKRVWNIAFAQTKLLRDPVAGTLHLLIFWGFVLFIFAVIETIFQGFYSRIFTFVSWSDLLSNNFSSGFIWITSYTVNHLFALQKIY